MAPAITKSTMFGFFERNYYEMRSECNRAIRMKGMSFSEDIFHDTIIRMYHILTERNRIFDEISAFKSYFFSSMYTNTIRDKMYYRNSHKVYMEETFGMDVRAGDQEHCDYDIILEDVCYNFGDLGKAFIEYTGGATIESICKEFPSIKNIYNKLRGIARYIREKYSDELDDLREEAYGECVCDAGEDDD